MLLRNKSKCTDRFFQNINAYESNIENMAPTLGNIQSKILFDQ